MTRYEAQIDLGNQNLSHTQVVDLTGTSKNVLDVGCATGDLARALGARGCKVSGVDIDPQQAEAARPDLENLVITDLNTSRLSEHFDPGTFDVIVFADVLEHVLDPASVLEDSLTLLGPEGRVVISVPNVAHGSVRLALLQGHWRYTEKGLLDATHIKFFTRASLVELVTSAGLAIDDFRATLADPLAVEVAVDGHGLPPTIVDWVRHQPEALAYQYVLSASVASEGSAGTPPVRPAVPEDEVRRRDKFTEMATAESDFRHRMLTVRDHVVGLESRVSSADARAKEARRRTKAAERQLRHAQRRLERAEGNVRRLRDLVSQQRRALDAANRRRLGATIMRIAKKVRQAG